MENKFKKVAIIGTQGIPAKYGGFETLVENMIGDNCSDDIKYTVFCSSKDYKEKIESYKGATLKYIPFHANGLQSIPYDICSLVRAIRGYDVILVLGVSGCIFLPIFRLLCKKKLIINIDGLEHRRNKWNQQVRRFLRLSESIAVKYADVIIADNKGIQNYVEETYHKPSVLIAYGGNHVQRNISLEKEYDILKEYYLLPKKYAITVCRIEPENNCHIILESFSKSDIKLVFIGNWNNSEYGRKLKQRYAVFHNVILIDALYDLDDLYALRKNCCFYVHGHSAGGTNPSLVEAMFFKVPILAYDVIYNKETTYNKANYFKTNQDLLQLLKEEYSLFSPNGEAMFQLATNHYQWHIIAKQYEKLY